MSPRDRPQDRRPADTPLRARPPDIELFPSLDRTWPRSGLGAIPTLIAQLPDPGELVAGTLVLVHASGRSQPGPLARWLLPKRREAHAAVRCTALLARGFRDIGAAADPKTGERLVWGFAPPSARPAAHPTR